MIPAAGSGAAHPAGQSGQGALAGRDIAAMVFAAEMYGVQGDQLAAVLAVSEQRARAVAARWRAAGHAESARTGPGPAWTWLTRRGLAACGLPYPAAQPALSRLAHLRAVTAIRLALQASAAYQAAGAHWRSERRLRSRYRGRVGLREHLPDGEVHWPDTAAVAWAGECWAVEAELTPKTVRRTALIMRELLARTGDYGCPAAEASQPGRLPRHARVLYVCAPAARPVVVRAAAQLGGAAARIEIRALPGGAALPAAVRLTGRRSARTGY
ncbi:MAG TPA: hypothetical protein VGI64_06405 [Streptosporangiaceae bacterium]